MTRVPTPEPRFHLGRSLGNQRFGLYDPTTVLTRDVLEKAYHTSAGVVCARVTLQGESVHLEVEGPGAEGELARWSALWPPDDGDPDFAPEHRHVIRLHNTMRGLTTLADPRRLAPRPTSAYRGARRGEIRPHTTQRRLMSRSTTVPKLLVSLAGLAVVACQGGDPPPAASLPVPQTAPVTVATTVHADDASTLDGVYTRAQAQRGAAVFEGICSECHETVDWADDAFRARWKDESVFRFWYYIYEQMPDGEPPYTLTREQVTDVLTYILQLNELPVGESELGTDDDSIDKFWLRWAPQ